MSENEKSIVVNWQGGEITLVKSEIARLEDSAASAKTSGDGIELAEKQSGRWTYKTNPVLKMNNGQVLEGQILRFDGEKIVLKKTSAAATRQR